MKFESLRWIVPILGIAVASSAFGQQTSRSVVYDFSSKKDAIVKQGESFGNGVSVDSGINDHESFTVKVVNINTTKYSVKVQVAAKSYFSTMPSQFKPFVASAGTTQAGGAADDALSAAQKLELSLEALASFAQDQIGSAKTQEDEAATKKLVTARVKAFIRSAPTLSANGADSPTAAYIANLSQAASELDQASPGQLVGFLRSLGDSAVDLAASAAVGGDADKKASKATLSSAAAKDQMKKAVDTIDLALTGDYMCSVSGTFMATGDESDVTITITDNQASPPKAMDPVSIAIPTNGGFKTDFSGGVMLTGLVNASYRSVANPAGGGTFVAQARSGTDSRITNVFFAHSYIRPSAQMRGFELGFSLGVSVDQTPVYAAGLSFLFGRTQRVGLTIGESFGSVTRVDGTGPFTSSTIPTTTVFMSRPFVALSYNF